MFVLKNIYFIIKVLFDLIMYVPNKIFNFIYSNLKEAIAWFKDFKYHASKQKKLGLYVDIDERQREIIYYYKKGFKLYMIHEYFLDMEKIPKCSFNLFLNLVFANRDLNQAITEINYQNQNYIEPAYLANNKQKEKTVIRYRLDPMPKTEAETEAEIEENEHVFMFSLSKKKSEENEDETDETDETTDKKS